MTTAGDKIRASFKRSEEMDKMRAALYTNAASRPILRALEDHFKVQELAWLTPARLKDLMERVDGAIWDAIHEFVESVYDAANGTAPSDEQLPSHGVATERDVRVMSKAVE